MARATTPAVERVEELERAAGAADQPPHCRGATPAGRESAQNVPSVYLVKIDGGKVVRQ